MNICKRSLTLIVLPAFVLKATLSQSLPDHVPVPEVVDVGVDFEAPDQRYPECPCFERGDLARFQKEVISSKADLIPGACTEKEDGSISLVIRYIDTEDIVTEDTEDTNEKPHSSPAGTSVSTINPPPGADPKKFLQGWTVESHAESGLGHCHKNPFTLLGPYPITNIETCKMYVRNACTLLKGAMCPCYKWDDILKLKEKIESDPNFIVDMEKSCKDPQYNDGLPFGIYKKDVEIEITQTNRNDMMRIYNVAGKRSYSDLMFEDELKLGTGPTNNGSPVCYDGSDAVYPDLDFRQSTHCRSLVQYLCDSMELGEGPDDIDGPPEGPNRSDDDENYRRNGKERRTCEHLTRNARAKKRNCRKRDRITGKFVFEHCRKSCYAGTCHDHRDFFFNGQSDKGCDWIAQNKAYCVDDHVARRCVAACGTECCKDDPDFLFEHDGVEGLSCQDVRKPGARQDFCQRKKIVNKCKMSCLKCPVQPRN